MTNLPQRPVSFPPGETEYVETFYRTHYADGTHTDTPPERVGIPSPPAVQLARMFASIERAKGGRTVRMRRTVTVTASEWELSPMPEEVPDAEREQGDPNDYCQRTLCGHARGFHVIERAGDLEAIGPCTRCGNPGKCSSFVAKRKADADA